MSSNRDDRNKSENASGSTEIEGRHNVVGDRNQVSSVAVPVHVHVYPPAPIIQSNHELSALTTSELELLKAYRSLPFDDQIKIHRVARKACKPSRTTNQ